MCKPDGASICKNGGSCYILENSDTNPKCSCIEGYSGAHCEIGNQDLYLPVESQSPILLTTNLIRINFKKFIFLM